MKEIKLTQGLIAIVDDDDYDKLLSHKWQAHKDKNTFYARKTVQTNGVKKAISMHREIMGALKGQLVDHKNGNGLDNRKENLRICDRYQNGWNSKKSAGQKSSSYKGVCKVITKITRRKEDGSVKAYIYHRFLVQICFKRERIIVGTFKTEIDAAKAYNQKALELFGEFAKLNTFYNNIRSNYTENRIV